MLEFREINFRRLSGLGLNPARPRPPCRAAGAMVLEHSFGCSVIPLGKRPMAAGVPDAKVTSPIAYQAGMPGLKVGHKPSKRAGRTPQGGAS